MILTAFVVVLVIFLIQWNVKRWKFLRPLDRYKGPTAYPIVGNALEFGNPDTLMAQSLESHAHFGRTIKFFLGRDVFIQTTDPKMVEYICSNQVFNVKSPEYKFFKNWLGEGLLTSSGDKWKSHRKILTPSFHYKILEEFVPVFDSASKILVDKLKVEVGNSGFNMYDYITLLTLDIICDTAMGTPIQAQKNPNSRYVRSIKEMCDVINTRVFSVISRWDSLYPFTPLFNREKNALKVIKEHSGSVISKRKEMLANNKSDESDENDSDSAGIKKKFTFLDVLLKGRINGEPITPEDIRDEVDTFMFEGHDTTAVGISFVLYCLSNHLDVQDKAYEEIKSIFGDDDNRPATYADLLEMKYMEMIIKESLRLYPSVPGFGRQVMEDIEYDGSILPKGLILIVAISEMHRNPELYPDPDIFDPERFTLENSAARHPYAYLPFSAGSRNCIGQKFAMLEIKSTVSKILRNFKLLPTIPSHEVKLVTKLTIFSSNGIKMRIENR